MDSGDEYPATVVGTDEETDIAVLKIKADKPLPFVKLGDSDKTEVGDWVLALGSPFGLQKTVTAGIISQKGRETPYATAFQKFIQTDAAINQGNSGGPLVNMDGEVIGVNSQIATSTGASNGIGFALPSTETLSVYKQIIASGRVRRGYLGARLDSVRNEFARVYGMKEAKGAIVTEVRDPTSPAGIAGLQPGDVILVFNGQNVESAIDLISKVAATAPDQSVNIDYLREVGSAVERKTATLKLQERPSNNRPPDDGISRKMPVDKSRPDVNPLGLTLVELTPVVAATYKLTGKTGLLVKDVNPASNVADVRTQTGEAALGEGDVIQRINRVDVKDLKTFGEIVGKLKPGDAVVLQVISYDARTNGVQFKIVQFTVR
jgi:serine protease Do